MKKIVTYIPVADADKLRQAVGEAGAGKLGKYSFCSFSVRGVGRFMPEKGAHPAIGSVDKLEQVEEERVEFICTDNILKAVVGAIKRVHPYEEVVIEISNLEETD